MGRRKQRVKIGNAYSPETVTQFGVPQGSALGPVLFNIYLRSFYHVVYKQGFKVLGYADDHQLYRHFNPNAQHNILSHSIKQCIDSIHHWMNSYFLKLNPDKTEIIVLGAKNVLKQIGIHGINLPGGRPVRFSSTAKNLGFFIDSSLTCNAQVNSVVRTCLNVIRNIAKIKSYLSRDLLKTLITTLVLNRLDTYNCIYYGIGAGLLDKLQSVQNAAAKVIYGRCKRDHVQDQFAELHWLQVRERVYYKIILFVFKCLHGMAPSDL